MIILENPQNFVIRVGGNKNPKDKINNNMMNITKKIPMNLVI